MSLKLTTADITAADSNKLSPEYCRVPDLKKICGISRGTTYALLKKGKFRSCLLRVQGRKSGVRLIDLQSVRDYIEAQMSRAEALSEN